MNRILLSVFLGLVTALIFYSIEFTTLAGAHPLWVDQLFYSGA